MVEILQRPLGWRLKPELNDQTGVRFLARFGKVMAEGRLLQDRRITLAGKVTGQETRPLDQTTYTYPVIRVEEYHLWPVPSMGPPNFIIGIGVSGTL
jgi:outer membrane lipoprotein